MSPYIRYVFMTASRYITSLSTAQKAAIGGAWVLQKKGMTLLSGGQRVMAT